MKTGESIPGRTERPAAVQQRGGPCLAGQTASAHSPGHPGSERRTGVESRKGWVDGEGKEYFSSV